MTRAPVGEDPGTAGPPPSPLRHAPLPQAGLPITEMLSRVEYLVSRRVEQALCPDGPPLDQWRVLHLLAHDAGHPLGERTVETVRPGSVDLAQRGSAMTGIATRIGVPAPTLTKIVDRLVESALVHRRVDETDRRRVLVFLSAHGRAVHDDLAPAVARAEAEVTAHLPGAETARLSALLAHLLHCLA